MKKHELFLNKFSGIIDFLSAYSPRRRHRIFIIPTGFCFIFNGLLLAGLLVGFFNHSVTMIAAGFVLLFIELLSMIEAHVNLRDIEIKTAEIVSANEFSVTQFIVTLVSESNSFGVSLMCIDDQVSSQSQRSLFWPRTMGQHAKKEIVEALIGFFRSKKPEKDSGINVTSTPRSCDLRFITGRRGVHTYPRIIAVSMFPFGLFRAWREFVFDQCYASFPSPIGDLYQSKHDELLIDAQGKAVKSNRGSVAEPDYSHHREFQMGDNLRRVDWRVSSRASKKYVRVFEASGNDREMVIRWVDARGKNGEAKLSQLALWLNQAFDKRALFRLELPGLRTQIGSGARHLKQCLMMLADFDLERMRPGGRL